MYKNYVFTRKITWSVHDLKYKNSYSIWDDKNSFLVVYYVVSNQDVILLRIVHLTHKYLNHNYIIISYLKREKIFTWIRSDDGSWKNLICVFFLRILCTTLPRSRVLVCYCAFLRATLSRSRVLVGYCTFFMQNFCEFTHFCWLFVRSGGFFYRMWRNVSHYNCFIHETRVRPSNGYRVHALALIISLNVGVMF